MAFDLENAVQQGFNRDIVTNDWNVEAANLEIILGDRSGGTKFEIKDVDNVTVAEVTSDGYLSVLGNAEVHGGNVFVEGYPNSEFVTMADGVGETSVFIFDDDPNEAIYGSKGSFGTSYNDGYLYVNVDNATTWKRVAYKSELDEIPTVTNEPSGFENETADSKITFTDYTREFKIEPRSGSYNIYLMGRKVTIGDDRTVIIPDTEGMHLIYFDYADDQLKSTMTFTDDIITKHAFVAAIYWDNTINQSRAIYFGEERHGITMDGATHYYLHTAFGSQWISGLALGSFTFGNGDSASHAEFSVTNGVVTDEDLQIDITDNSPQELDPLARIPVFYKIGSGSTPLWRKKNQDEFPLIYSGTAGFTGGSGRVAYNQLNVGTWQLTELPSNDYYVLMHYFATNNGTNLGAIDAYGEPFVGILGEQYYTTLIDASDGARSEINNLYASGMPVKEFVPIATVIFQTSSSYANTPKARVVKLSDGSDYVDWRIIKPVPGLGVSVVDHGNLIGLLDDDHPQYLLADGTRPLTAAWDATYPITTPEIDSGGTLILTGQDGIILDGYGSGVIPASSCTDSLGNATNGWTDLYLCSVSTVIALSDIGDSTAPNTSSGAYLVGTNSDNFLTFGLTMTSDNVQAALEAIDGYLQSSIKPTLQQVYDNSCPIPQIIMNDTCGPIYFKGTEQVVFDNDGGVDITNNLIVRGDLTVNGDTTTVNTENLIVEDRLIRLNIGAQSGFSGTVGIEAEVGADGYVEFHWDDTAGRWEISIDRNTTPEAQTFRPLAYLSDTATTLDLSSTGTSGYPTAGPNPDAGASVVNTNATNFPNSFGPDMTDDSVQAALEAIDGYFVSVTNYFNDAVQGLTFQDIYDQSCPNPTIVLTEECGPITFDGTEQVIFNNDNGVVINNLFLQEGSGPFVVDVDNEVNISSVNAVNIYSKNEVTISGEGGIVLDGYGNNVIPATSCTDSLGDSTHGWTDIWICKDGTPVSVIGAGDNDAPNTSSGAAVIGTNPLNFDTFGPDMTDNTVQAALESIDGYIGRILSEGVVALTFQDIYDNSCGNETITLSEACGPITFDGTGQVIFNNTDGVLFNQEVTISGNGPVVVDVVGQVIIASDGDVSLTAGDNVNISGENGIVLDGYGNDVIPATSCTDALGDSTHGWADVWVCKNSIPVSIIGAGDNDAPNTDSGATIVGTNPLNFGTFGPDMTDNTVQAALEAIDGYIGRILSEGVVALTFQDIYDNSCGNETIVLSEACGSLTIDGTGQVIFNNTDGVLLTQNLIVTGDGSVVVNVAGPVNVSSDTDINVASGDTVNISGGNGIVLDGYGNNVIPATSCTDSLGDSTHGWSDVWVCKDGTAVSIIGAGSSSTPNTSSGAAVVGTNPLNFETFGSNMTDNTVQAALEAIDGYIADIISGQIEFDPFIQVHGLDINGGVLNGVAKVWTSAGTPGLSFPAGGTSRASWSLPVPADWDGVSDIVVKFVWAPATSGSGDVAWRLEYKSLSVTELASSAAVTVDYAQAANGTAEAIQTTGSELIISGSAISTSDELIVINAVRRGGSGSDTYGNNAYLYLVKYSYVAKNIV